jgi:hypothetical protein
MYLTYLKKSLLILLATSLLSLTACSSHSAFPFNPYISRLKNRGPVPLSGDNPYLAANSLLINESNRSEELKGFIKQRGGPNALQVEKSSFGLVAIELYYMDKREYYKLDDVDNTWLITGPFKLDKSKLETLKPIAIQMPNGKPNLSIPANKQNLTEQRTKNNLDITKSEKISDSSKASLGNITKTSSVAVKPQNSSNETEKLIKTYGRHAAEITPKGDIVHYVVFPGETLSLITRWYTLDIKNLREISLANKLNDGTMLSIGDSIVIPANLAKNKLRLSEEALSALEEKVSEGVIP